MAQDVTALDDPNRLAALHSYEILDTPPELAFDRLAQLAAQICQTPLAAITLVDEKRQWFKAKVGFTEGETPREIAFCAWAVHQPDLFVVPDASKDERFATNPLVTTRPTFGSMRGPRW